MKTENIKIEHLGRTTWENIKVGEVFAFKGCWIIMVKTSEKKALILTEDILRYTNNRELPYQKYNGFYPSKYVGMGWWGIIEGKLTPAEGVTNKYLYKLPLSVQRLWRTD